MKRILTLIIFISYIFNINSLLGESKFFDHPSHSKKGQEVELLLPDNGREAYDIFSHIIDKAKSSIEFLPCMGGGQLFIQFLERISKRMNEVPNLKVYLMTQPIFIDQQDKEFIISLKKMFPERFSYVFTDFSPVKFPRGNVTECHVKMCVVDEKYSIMGGTNLEDLMCTSGDVTPEDNQSERRYAYMERALAFRDQDIIIKGEEQAKIFRKEFFKYFAMWQDYARTKSLKKNPNTFSDTSEYYPIEEKCDSAIFDSNVNRVKINSTQIKIIFSGPYQSKNQIESEYVKFISNAKENVLASNLFFLPSKSIYQSLISSLNKGVIFQLITNGSNENSPKQTENYTWGGRMNYMSVFYYGKRFNLFEKGKAERSMVNSKVSIYEYNVWETNFHKKTLIVDGKHLLLGSYNLGDKSNRYDYECCVSIDSEEVCKQALMIFEKDKKLSKQVSPEEVRGWYFDLKTHILGHCQLNHMPS